VEVVDVVILQVVGLVGVVVDIPLEDTVVQGDQGDLQSLLCSQAQDITAMAPALFVVDCKEYHRNDYSIKMIQVENVQL